MWSYDKQALVDSRGYRSGGVKLRALQYGAPVSYQQYLAALNDDAGAREGLLQQLRDAPFEAYFWETPPVTTDTQQQAFEFVLIEAPALAGLVADPRPFREHFTAAPVASFNSLGADALLVAPTPLSAAANYAHLAGFVRSAPKTQQHELIAEVGRRASQRVGAQPLWVSTSGLGVAWLHVRLDSWPKYYTHRPYTARAPD